MSKRVGAGGRFDIFLDSDIQYIGRHLCAAFLEEIKDSNTITEFSSNIN